MKTTIKALLICCIAVCAIACKKTTSATFSKADRPAVSLGSWWRYRVVDSFHGNAADTVKLTITTLAASADTQRCIGLIERNGVTIDTAHLFMSNSLIEYNDDTILGYYQLKVPSSVGQTWSYSIGIDNLTSVVSYTKDYPVSDQQYDVFTFTATASAWEYGSSVKYLFSPGIGLVQVSRGEIHTGGMSKKSAQLIDYHL